MLVQLRGKVKGSFSGRVPTEQDAALRLNGDVDVYKPDGQPLCLLRRGALPKDELELAHPALFELRKQKTNNRGAYTGLKNSQKVQFSDGHISKSTRVYDGEGNPVAVSSAIVGYFDRNTGRFPFCRATAFTANQVEQWNTLLPMTRSAAELFRQAAPARHAKQQELADKCHPEFIIKGTPFSTLTVNNNVAPSGIHKDAGDFKEGLGMIAVLRRGKYRGGWLVFPEYRVGVDLQDGDVLFFNSHDWHGVTEVRDAEEGWQRISVVFYLREKIQHCGTPAEELERAKNRPGFGAVE